jgi:hypothetical protein
VDYLLFRDNTLKTSFKQNQLDSTEISCYEARPVSVALLNLFISKLKLIYIINSMTLLRAMCEFISYDVKEKNRMRNKIEDWEVEPEIEKVHEEQQEPIPVTQ